MKIIAFLYLVDVLSRLLCFFEVIAKIVGFFIVISVVIFLAMNANKNTDNDLYIFFFFLCKKIVASWLCLLLLLTAIPRKDFMYIAGGLYLGNEVLENPKVKTLVEKSYRILDDKLNTILQKIEGVENEQWDQRLYIRSTFFYSNR